jgi:hypothetical protein
MRYDLPQGIIWRKIIREGRLSRKLSEALANLGVETVISSGVQIVKPAGVGGISSEESQ